MIIDRLQQQLAERSPRERLVLLSGVGLAIPLLIWVLIWQPLLAANQRAHQQLEIKHNELRWMEQSAARVLALRDSGGAAVTGIPEQAITREATRLTLAISRIEPGSGNRFNLWLVDADYHKVVQLLAALQRQGFSLETLSITRQSAPGQVNVRLSVGASG